MNLAIVVGSATSTVRHRSLTGEKLLIVQPLAADGHSADGNPLLAIDRLGAGAGDRILITSDGPTVQELLQDKTTPVRWSVVGIAD